MCIRIKYILAIMLLLLIPTSCKDNSVEFIPADTEGNVEYEDHQIVVDSYEETSEGQNMDKVPVYVCGAVVKPGVYYVETDSLKVDALDMAGGLLEDGALDYVNLAEAITEGEKIYFPYKDEVTGGMDLMQGESDQESNGKVNINMATKEELMTLPGIGESKAEAIIRYREDNGPFRDIQDITNISGIKEGVYNNIKEHIIVK